MLRQTDLTRKFETVFEPPQAAILAEVVTESYRDLVKTGDFNELKAIVKDLAEAQKRTESKVEELAEAQKRTESKVEDLAEAQNRTELRMKELAEAQNRTELQMEKMSKAQESMLKAQEETQYQIQTLNRQVRETNNTLGGLGQSVAYSLENEAYRLMPAWLEEKYGIKMTDRFVRTYIDGEEVNLFGRGQRDGEDILIVGEVKLRLDERRKAKTGEIAVFEQLEAKAEIVKRKHPDEKILLVLITHHARPSILEAAEEKGILIVQSFEW